LRTSSIIVEVEVGDHQLVVVLAGLGDDLPARVHEVAGAVELADVPGRLGADAVDGADVVAVGDGVGGLLELPQVLAEAGDGGAGVEDDLGAVEAQAARALGEVAVVADVDADWRSASGTPGSRRRRA
jgi:hypothetical protein